MHNLFKPGKIGKLQIKNRIVFAPVEKLNASLPNCPTVGDCVRPGKILNAIWDAYHTARLL